MPTPDEMKNFKDSIENENESKSFIKKSLSGALDDTKEAISKEIIDGAIECIIRKETELNTEQKIKLMSKLFPLALDDRVRNRFLEDGIIDSAAIDNESIFYLVKYKDHKSIWERPNDIKKIENIGFDKEEIEAMHDKKMDIPEQFINPKPYNL